MIYGIIKQNNGFVNVYSEPGMGSTFKIYLPRHVIVAEPILQPIDLVAPDAQGGETILLVEDDSAVLNIVRRMLEHLGYTVLAATTPGEAIRLTEVYHDEIVLLLTDVIMPEISGRDLADKLLSLHPHLKCLFMSGYSAHLIADGRLLETGAHFIQKPFSMQELAIKVCQALGGE
jgi:DNA-binding NtrC family response regulator